MALRREATTALLGLFEFRGVRWHQRARSTRGADEAGGGGLTIIDDDEEDAIGLPGADADAQGDNDSFPWLSGRLHCLCCWIHPSIFNGDFWPHIHACGYVHGVCG
jgi:hypothetical protein